MTILGIIAEYDPFHNGHLYHLNEAKKRVQPDFTYIVLSPCLKQRGTFSMLSPLDRACLALEAGADAVFALPVLWTVRDAEHYALGAVSMLSRLGATHLAFGVETDDLPLLRRAAELLESPSAAFERALKEALSRGAGFPSAVSAAAHAVLPQASDLLNHPNNVLAVSYLRAVRRLNASITPVPIRRKGNYHDSCIDPAFPSASALRDALLRGNYGEAFAAMPSRSVSLIRRRFLEGRIPDPAVGDTLLLSRLRSMSGADYTRLPDLSEGLENALRSAALTFRGRDELIRALTGVRYPAARISRLCACALLQATAEDILSLPLPESALLLGLKKDPGMTALWKDLPLPVVSSFTEWKKTAHPADLLAWRLWAQCCHLPDTLPFSEKTVSI
jgi:predicted nucleotidyltransferase